VNKFNRGIAKVKKELAENGNPPPYFDLNRGTEFRVTVVARQDGEVNPAVGEVNPTVGEVNPTVGEVKRTTTDDELVYQLICKTPGTKREKIFLEIKTSLRSIERSLKRLKEAGRIEYRGSDKTGGWFIRN
ncbi:MAG: hypothetical protein IKW23_05580, partial [Kiritimatiellae bacterium]|nr:hypothetical protein [Kiritimatiellia bacterium]